MSAKAKSPDRFIGIVTPIVLLGLWEVAAHFKFIDPRFFPPPSSIVHQFAALVASGELGANVAASLQRLGLGIQGEAHACWQGQPSAGVQKSGVG